ncbi:hypothetical protein V1481_02095 [Aeromonas enteropelogenes]|uniref:hypothetical protein n=1 Tax=Aeromonas enteropelogenes TaxID=29489 RepID=UPI0031372BDA
MTAVLDSRLVDPGPLIPLVRQRLSGPLDNMIRQALLHAAIDFCRRSALIHLERRFDEVLEGQTVSFAKACSINRQARQLANGPQVTGSVIHRITSQGVLLQPGADYHVQSAESIRFLVTLRDVCIIGAIEPLPSATLIPAALVEDYAEAMADGAASILQLQPGKPWASPALAQLNLARFNEAVRDAHRFRIEQTPNAQIRNPVRRHQFI